MKPTTTPLVQFSVERGMDSIPIECDSVRLKVGKVWVELTYRKSDCEISLSASNALIIVPRATNVVRLEVRR